MNFTAFDELQAELEYPIEVLIQQIISINDAWDALRDLCGSEIEQELQIEHSIINLLSQQKGLLQAQLLRKKHAYLAQATDLPDCWSVRLNSPIRIGKVNFHDACHMPKWVAEKLLLPEELAEIKR